MKPIKPEAIPVYQMKTQTSLGIDFSYLDMTDEYDEIIVKSNINVIHRDNYYMFFFIEAANAIFSIDFDEVLLTGESVFYVRPGQVHFASSFREAKGWTLAIDPMLVDKECKNIFEAQFITQKPIILDKSISAKMNKTARLLHSVIQSEPTVFGKGIILNLANVFIGLIAEQYAVRQENIQQNTSRAALIAHQFKGLLSENFRTTKSPIQYARMLNYSLSHLNESVKKITGFPVSYWIHQQIVLEAKRLLYYTDMEVKEIAVALGYEDYTYFSRLFSKVVGVSPCIFRCKFHE